MSGWYGDTLVIGYEDCDDTVPTLDSEGEIGVRHINYNNEVVFSGVKIIGDQKELIWVTGLPEQVTLITIGQEFVLEGQKVNYTLEALN